MVKEYQDLGASVQDLLSSRMLPERVFVESAPVPTDKLPQHRTCIALDSLLGS